MTDRRAAGSVTGVARAGRSVTTLRFRWKVKRGSATRLAYQSRLPGEPERKKRSPTR